MDVPLPRATQALVALVHQLEESGVTDPERWKILGDATAEHGRWLERYLRTIEKRPDSWDIALTMLEPALQSLRPFEADLSEPAKALLKLSEEARRFRGLGLPGSGEGGFEPD